MSDRNKYYNTQKQNQNHKEVTRPQANNVTRKAEQSYSYYSRLLEKPFDTVDELMAAEEAVRAAQRAKEDKAAQKKADATVVEDAFKALNAARRAYKENVETTTTKYREELESLRAAFEAKIQDIKSELASAEKAYQNALKNFSEKYPEGYHITLKDGDFETTLHRDSHVANKSEKPVRTPDLTDLFFNFFMF